MKLAGAWKLWRASLGDYRRHWKRYLAITAIVAVPTDLLGLIGATADAVVGAYLTLASLFMTVALIWAIVRADEPRLMIRQAYYDGAAALLRFILVGAALATMVLPASLGLLLFELGSASPTGSASTGELVLLGILAALLALPTVYWLCRYILAIYRVVAEGDWPVAALRASRRLTMGRFWPVLGRVVLLPVWLALALLLPAIVLIGLELVTQLAIFAALFQVSVTVIALPLTHLYLYRLYLALKEA